MFPTGLWLIAVGLAIGISAYAILVVGKLFFGLTAAAAILLTAYTWETRTRDDSIVVASSWGIFLLGLWYGRIDSIILSAIAGIGIYTVYTLNRG